MAVGKKAKLGILFFLILLLLALWFLVQSQWNQWRIPARNGTIVVVIFSESGGYPEGFNPRSVLEAHFPGNRIKTFSYHASFPGRGWTRYLEITRPPGDLQECAISLKRVLNRALQSGGHSFDCEFAIIDSAGSIYSAPE